MNWQDEINLLGENAKEATSFLATLSTQVKNTALNTMARALRENAALILEANSADLARNSQLATLDRLKLNEMRIESMARGLEEIAGLKDPIGEVPRMWKAEQNLRIGRMRVPLGVISIIYEARPNVTADAIGLCLKSGNALILKGGKEASHSNLAIVEILQQVLRELKFPKGTLGYLKSTKREATIALMQCQAIDVLIPRGGKALKNAIIANAKVPFIMTGEGNCHTFIDESADLEMAKSIVLNAKCQRSAVCNALETLLICENIAKDFLPSILKELAQNGVELRSDEVVRKFFPQAKVATQNDWECEFHDLILAVKVVKNIDEAMQHISKYGSKHSEAIITKSYENAQKFLNGIDAAAVYVNASTRFTDGSVFGFGAEMGISTQKLHARGPMGIEQLTSTKFIIYGEGQIRN